MPATTPTPTYHHGDLRRALVEAAVATVAASGPAALSLRALAAQVGVSHAAPVHHFKDKAGLFTAVATEGFGLLADQLTEAWEESGEFLNVGVRYVQFALSHRGHFEVMFRPELLNVADPDLLAAQHAAYALLRGPVAAGRRGKEDHGAFPVVLASWSIVHGLATLILGGNLIGVDLTEPEPLIRRVLSHLQVV